MTLYEIGFSHQEDCNTTAVPPTSFTRDSVTTVMDGPHGRGLSLLAASEYYTQESSYKLEADQKNPSSVLNLRRSSSSIPFTGVRVFPLHIIL